MLPVICRMQGVKAVKLLRSSGQNVHGFSSAQIAAKTREEEQRMIDELPSQILRARDRIQKHVFRTPLMHSVYLSNMAEGANVFIKLESDQLTGSFKIRGAFNKMSILSDTDKNLRSKGVTTASSGNHGLACLDASKKLKIPLSIYCSEAVTQSKRQILRENGADLHLFGQDCVDAEIKARKTAEETGAHFISPYNDIDIIAGQGTIGCEILEDLPEVDYVLVAVGGGGLIGGIARYIKQVKPSTKVIGCQPKNSKVMYESINAGKIIYEESFETLSDGTAGGIEEDTITFPICRDFIDEWIIQDEEQIGKAVMFMLQKHHKVVEGAAGTSVGAYMNNAEKFAGKNVVIVSCGSNIAMTTLRSLMDKYTE